MRYRHITLLALLLGGLLLVTAPAGAGAGNTVIRPATDQPYNSGTDTGVTVINVTAANVTITGVEVDGTMTGGTGNAYRAKYGILGSSVSNLTVGHSFVGETINGVACDLMSTGCTFEYVTVQDFGFDVDHGAGLRLTNSTGTVGGLDGGNDVSDGAAPGILLEGGASGEVSYNLVSDVPLCLAVADNTAPATLEYNELTNCGAGGAIRLTSPDAVVNAGYNEGNSSTSSGIVVLGGGSNAINLTNNRLTGDGTANEAGLYITTDLGGGSTENATGVSGAHNALTGYHFGVYVDADDAGVNAVATLSNNNIQGTSQDVSVNGANATVTAEDNYWGGAAASVSGSGVDADPYAESLVDGLTASVREVGETDTLDFKLAVTDLYGFQFIVNYNTTPLDYDAHTWASGPFYPDQTAWDGVADEGAGTVKFAASQLHNDHPDPADLSGDEVADVTFECTAVGSSDLTFSDDVLSTIDGDVIPSAWVGSNITCIQQRGAIAAGDIDLQGRSDDSGAIVFVYPHGANTTVAGDGSFTLSGLAPDSYTINVETELYLDAVKTGVSVTGGNTTTLPSVKLLGGDANDDDKVDVEDITIIASDFGHSGVSIGDERADINNDDTVNIQDLVLAGGNYTKESPVTWNP